MTMADRHADLRGRPAVSVDDATQSLSDAADAIKNTYRQWLIDRGGGYGIRRKSLSAAPLWLVQAGTGVGKTTQLIPTLALALIPLLVVVETKEQAEAVADILRTIAPGINIWIWQARYQPGEDGNPSAPGACPMMDKIAMELAGQNHLIMPNACVAGCPPGKALDPEYAAEHPDVAPCGYLGQNEKAKHAQVLIITADAYTDDHTQYTPPGGGQTIDRLVVKDEIGELYARQDISSDDIMTALQAIRSHENPAMQPIERALGEIFTGMAKTEDELQGLEAWNILGKELPQWLSGKAVQTAEWEQPIVSWKDETVEAPLRMIADLVECHKAGRLTLNDGKIHMSIPALWYQAILQGKRPFCLLDATPEPEVVNVVTARQGNIVDIHTRQEVKVLVDKRSWTKSMHGENRQERRLQRAQKLGNLYHSAEKYGLHSPNILTYMVDTKLLIEHCGVPAQKAGWYGNHDKAQNDWLDTDLIMAGNLYLPPAEEKMKWVCYRATMNQLGVELPAWTNRRSRGHRVEVTPGQWIAWPDKLSAEPEIAKWQIAEQSRRQAQALGRIRGNLYPGHTALIIGGVSKLSQYGYDDVEVIAHLPELGGTHATWNMAQHAHACLPMTRAWKKEGRVMGLLATRRATGIQHGHDTWAELKRELYNKFGGNLNALEAALADAVEMVAAYGYYPAAVRLVRTADVDVNAYTKQAVGRAMLDWHAHRHAHRGPPVRT